ncbi:MAG: spheroidene monooxygenase [Pseudomonadota bacterium]
MQIVSLSLFKFDTMAGRAWVLPQMQFARGPLSRLPGAGFIKLMGTGPADGFHLAANFGVYAILATWPSLEAARTQVNTARPFARFRARASEHATVYAAATRSVGEWDGAAPFDAWAAVDNTRPVGVLTRATIKWRHLGAFWKDVPAVSRDIGGYPDVHFKLGMGEVPGVQQVTFSVWENFEDVRRFAYASGPHATAMRRAHDQAWFSEELFARFVIVHQEGVWNDQPLLPEHVLGAARARNRSAAEAGSPEPAFGAAQTAH